MRSVPAPSAAWRISCSSWFRSWVSSARASSERSPMSPSMFSSPPGRSASSCSRSIALALAARESAGGVVEGRSAGRRRTPDQNRSKSWSKVGMSSPRFTMVARRASLKTSRSSSESSSRASKASIASAVGDADPALPQDVRELEIFCSACRPPGRLVQHALLVPARRRAPPCGARPSWRRWVRRASRRLLFFWSSLSSSALGLPDVALVLEDDVEGLALTRSSSSSVALSASSARAQSSVSLMDGVFFRSSLRKRCITPTSSSDETGCSAPGTLTSRIFTSSSSFGKSM